MTIEELRKIANSMGYTLAKTKKPYDCSCWHEYPNPFYVNRRKNDGKCICTERYEFMEYSVNGKTRCRKRRRKNEQGKSQNARTISA